MAINNPDAAAADVFGGSVAISGNKVLVGACEDDTGADNAGSAYLFDATTGALLQTFNNPMPMDNDLFGFSVAISGDNVLIGAYEDDAGEANAGSAYLFDAVTGVLLRTFNNPTPAVGDLFGASVAISGNNVLVGAYWDDTGATNAGSAYLFDAVTGSILQTFNNPTPGYDLFGYSVAISGNGVLVGAHKDATGYPFTGSAYLFDATTGALLRTFKSPDPYWFYDFGYSVAVSGSNVLIGSLGLYLDAENQVRAYLFDAATGTLLQTFNSPFPAYDEYYSVSVAISGDNVVMGAYRADGNVAPDEGRAYLFDATTGDLLHTLNNPTPAEDDQFGWSVAISGNDVLVGANWDDTGASAAGSAYLFDVSLCPTPSPSPTASPSPTLTPSPTPSPSPSPTPSPTATQTPSPTPIPLCPSSQTFSNPAPAAGDLFGWSVAISGNKVLVGACVDDTGAANAGSAYLFDAVTGALLQTFNNPTPMDGDLFGFSVAISGNNVLVGAYEDDAGAANAGCAHLFDAVTGALLRTFNNPTPAGNDYFGYSVAIEGNNVLIGAHWDNTGASHAGSAYLFDAATGALLRTFNNPAPAINDRFGNSVAISGNNALVGVRYDDAFVGSVYLFDAATGALLQNFSNPAPAAGDQFGSSVAISGNNALVGARYDDTGATDAGSAYLFDAATGVLLRTFNNPAPGADDYFGETVAISGNKVLVGATQDDAVAVNSGVAYLFDAATGAPPHAFNNPAQLANSFFGCSVAISGNNVLVGAYADDTGATYAGRAYLFDFSTCPTPFDNSALTAHTIPGPAGTGYDYTFTITLQNTGNTTWTTADGFTLTKTLDACGVFAPIEIALPGGADVPPGTSAVFTGTLTAPATPQNCDLQFRMTHAAVPFGAFAGSTIVVQDAANDASFPNDTIPPTMSPSQGLWVGLTVRNRGNTQWNPAVHQLKVLDDPCVLLPGATIPLDTFINPNTSRQLLVYLTAPAATGPCSIQLQMEELAPGPVRNTSGPGLFGDVFNATIQIADPPNAARDWTAYE